MVDTVSGDGALYTTSVYAVFLLRLVHVLPFTTLLGSTLSYFLQLPGQILSVTNQLIELSETLLFMLLAPVGVLSF